MWQEKSDTDDATKIPTTAKIKTRLITPTSTQQEKLVSYQGVMAFRKNGFWSRCMLASIKIMFKPQYIDFFP